MFDGWVKGKVLAYEAGKTLSYTWHTADWDKETTPSIVSFKFSKTKSGTTILLKHAGLPNAQEQKEHRGGWHKHVFEPLKQYLEHP